MEEARWRRRRDEADTHFSTAKDFLASKKARLAMRFSKSQAEVWDSVSEEQEQLAKAVQKEIRDAEPPSSEAIGAWLESHVSAGATHAEEERLLPRTRIRTHRGTSLHRFEAFDTALDEASPLHVAVVAE